MVLAKTIHQEAVIITLPYHRISLSKDPALKYDSRLQVVRYAAEYGVKPAARKFETTVKTVRKWLNRWRDDNHSRASLSDHSRAPKTCPHKTPPALEKKVLAARNHAPCLGPKRLKQYYDLPVSEGAIQRILFQNHLTKRQKKKHEKKRDMRELKARFKPFEENQVDVKYLNDIPWYVEQMWANKELPRFEYTWRDVKTGGLFLGFAQELSEANACCFIAAVGAHLKRCGYDLKDYGTIQTDNGSEFSGAERKTPNDRGFTHTVVKLLGATHRFIPPGKKNHQADVETVHQWIEKEFFDLETFADRADYDMRTSAWQLWWNTTRKNSYKAQRTPDMILLEDDPTRDPKTWLLPALDLDALSAARSEEAIRGKNNSGGYYLPALPEINGIHAEA